MTVQTKRCTICGIEKPLRGNFYSQVRFTVKRGLQSFYRGDCRDCMIHRCLVRYHAKKAGRQ